MIETFCEYDLEEMRDKLDKLEVTIESTSQEKDEVYEEMEKLKIELERETAEKNEAYKRIQELDGKVNTHKKVLEKLKEIVEKSGGKIPEDCNVEHFVKNSTGAPPEIPNLEAHAGPPPLSPLAGLLTPGVQSPPSVPSPPPPLSGVPPSPPPFGGAIPGPLPPLGPPGAPGLPDALQGKGKRNVPKPSQPLKSFNWSKLPDTKIKGTVWTVIDDSKIHEIMDFNDFDRMFSAYQKSKNDQKDGGAEACVAAEQRQELSFIDSRKAQNCQILLSKLKTSNKQLSRAVLTMDKDGELSVEMLEQVKFHFDFLHGN
ncbi:disheveled-associated activator of morphogenesis 1-A-like [Xenia sp. Carnegie-2017]|uniref:disheveled-associated activator of morphogenesis 1-A-like n=1 Tax=Xenia sp. Carnegie-2017 TaxID=2897299 RepID=UPI001F040C3F|nr:disheveled-associated activator of morphogenesis 1-A-like [Xenia sp. Carnegie-2017]